MSSEIDVATANIQRFISNYLHADDLLFINASCGNVQVYVEYVASTLSRPQLRG